MDTVLKFRSCDTILEIRGSEEFVRHESAFFGPWLGGAPAAAPGPASAPAEAARAAPQAVESELAAWYRKVVPPRSIPSMQNTVLMFGYFLNRTKRQFIFRSDDMKTAFQQVGRAVPKSLLQILGSLKRDSGLLFSGDKRGEYCLTPAGLKHIEAVLGLKREAEAAKVAREAAAPPPAPAPATPPPSIPGEEGASELDRLFSRFPKTEASASKNGDKR